MILGTQDKDFFPKDIENKFQYVKDFGFDCIELDGKLLVENVETIKKAIKNTGLIVTSACGGYRGWIGDFIEERRLNGVEDLKKILKAVAEVGGNGVVVPAAWGMFTYRLPPMVSPRSHEGDIKAILESLDALDPVAEKFGVKIFLEPLNRYQDHMLNTTADGVNIIKKGGYQNVLITADFYHMDIEEDNVAATFRNYKDYIGHVHIAENHRYQPGTGHINFKELIGTLKEIGYDGPLINEGRIRGENPVEAYKKSIPYVRQFM